MIFNLMYRRIHDAGNLSKVFSLHSLLFRGCEHVVIILMTILVGKSVPLKYSFAVWWQTYFEVKNS